MRLGISAMKYLNLPVDLLGIPGKLQVNVYHESVDRADRCDNCVQRPTTYMYLVCVLSLR